MSNGAPPSLEQPVHSSHADTKAHIRRVQQLLGGVIDDFTERQRVHDASKLVSPEVEYFDTYTPLLKNLAYGSAEYKACLAEMKPGLDHHYANNDHHPEFFGDKGLHGMSLIQLLEMLVDWKAAGERHGGCLFRSIEMNAGRFKYGPELKNIFLNTARHLGFQPEPTVPDKVYIDGVEIPDTDFYILSNSVRFNTGPRKGAVARLVFNCFKIDHTFLQAPGVFSCLVYNQILPEAVRLDYSDEKLQSLPG